MGLCFYTVMYGQRGNVSLFTWFPLLHYMALREIIEWQISAHLA